MLVLLVLAVTGCGSDTSTSSASVSDNKDVIETCTWTGVITTGATNADNSHYYDCHSGAKSMQITIGANDGGMHITGIPQPGWYAATNQEAQCDVLLYSAAVGGNRFDNMTLKNKFLYKVTFETDDYTCSYY